jgi:DNA repair exonuclease SbcCD ATPase subunit
MIYIQKLKWSNWFSYGADNELDFTETSLLQICGSNGTGKSSIPIILEESLFGKNSKGIKKADIPNRAISGAAVDSEVYFCADGVQYVVKLHRKGASTKLVLLQDGEDISSHTATGTYKQISNILGLDYKLYSQLTYQSSTSSLQFLKATDTERKKFLISLFSLDEYIKLHELFKETHKDLNSETAYIAGKASSSTTWLSKHEDFDYDEETLEVELPLETEGVDELVEVKASISNIKSINVGINKNNEYKKSLLAVDKDSLVYEQATPVPGAISDVEGDIKVLRADTARYNKEVSALEDKGTDKACMTCGTIIEKAEDVAVIVENRRVLADDSKYKTDALLEQLKELKAESVAYKKHVSAVEEFEKLTNYIDSSIPEEIIVDTELVAQVTYLAKQIKEAQTRFEAVRKRNSEANTRNAKKSIIEEEFKEHTEILKNLSTELAGLQKKVAILQNLKDAFSTTGLITYKLEFVVKALEEEINNYLIELSSGRFQIVFILVKDKLNIEVVDNGVNISISALSTGELARVNTSTVLAIRKLMSNISKTKLNLLFLDEIMGVLDEEGKDTLIALLMRESLNTLIVSHEFQHPLVPQVLVSKNSADIASIEKVNG